MGWKFIQILQKIWLWQSLISFGFQTSRTSICLLDLHTSQQYWTFSAENVLDGAWGLTLMLS